MIEFIVATVLELFAYVTENNRSRRVVIAGFLAVIGYAAHSLLAALIVWLIAFVVLESVSYWSAD